MPEKIIQLNEGIIKDFIIPVEAEQVSLRWLDNLMSHVATVQKEAQARPAKSGRWLWWTMRRETKGSICEGKAQRQGVVPEVLLGKKNVSGGTLTAERIK